MYTLYSRWVCYNLFIFSITFCCRFKITLHILVVLIFSPFSSLVSLIWFPHFALSLKGFLGSLLNSIFINLAVCLSLSLFYAVSLSPPQLLISLSRALSPSLYLAVSLSIFLTFSPLSMYLFPSLSLSLSLSLYLSLSPSRSLSDVRPTSFCQILTYEITTYVSFY